MESRGDSSERYFDFARFNLLLLGRLSTAVKQQDEFSFSRFLCSPWIGSSLKQGQ